MFSNVSRQILGQLQRVKLLTGLMFFERLQPRVGAVAAGEGVVGEERHQLPQLQRDAGLVVEQQAAAALQLHYVQVSTLAAETKKEWL